MNHEYTIPSKHSREPATLKGHLEQLRDLTEENKAKIAVGLGLAATAIASVAGLNYLRGGGDDPSQYEHTTAIHSVTLEDGARIRHDPWATDEPYIQELDHTQTIATPHGTYSHTERHNGHWTGVSVTDIPNFDAKGDNDGIVWINEQKVSASVETEK